VTLPELSNSQLVLVAVAAVVVCWLAGQLVVLVRVLLNRETVDQDPQLVEVIEQLTQLAPMADHLAQLVDYGHDLYQLAEQEAEGNRDRDDRLDANVADIADVLGHWHATAVLPVALDTVADRRTAREAVTAEQAEAKRATMNRGGQL
jgi:hypothetical protein